MRIKERRFSVPFAVFEDDISGEHFRLLCFLFSVSDFSGAAKVTYPQIKKDAGIGSEHTIASGFLCLERLGWIFHRKRTRDGQTLWMQIPPRYRRSKSKLHSLIFSTAKSAG